MDELTLYSFINEFAESLNAEERAVLKDDEEVENGL